MRIAHRGASGFAPENTLAAFRKALELGVDGIELDVRLTADERLVVVHDATLDRATDRSGRVAELTLKDLRLADAGARFHPAYKGQRIPTLEEALEDIPSNIRVFVEIKVAEAARPAARTVKGLGREDRAVLISFLGEALRTVREEDPALQVGFLVEDPLVQGDDEENGRAMLARARSLGTSLLGIHWEMATGPCIRAVHQEGGKVWAWAPDEPQDLARLARDGIDGIASNFPDRLNALEGL